jgi:hypothetical protein
VILFAVVYNEPLRDGPLLWIAGFLLIGTLARWIAAARATNPEGEEL